MSLSIITVEKLTVAGLLEKYLPFMEFGDLLPVPLVPV
jgi:hypothetical protein